MTVGDQEVEVKFYLTNRTGLLERLKNLKAQIDAPRVREVNLRFDTADFSLRNAGQALRLRQDAHAIMTFKGPSNGDSGALSRQEIEFEVSDLAQAQRLLQALGYRIVVRYDKFRTTYSLPDEPGVHITVDEMPYGDFAEVECAGVSNADAAVRSLQKVTQRLGLKWAARIQTSYLSLFERLSTRRGFTMRNLTFEEFEGLTITPDDLDVKAADA